MTRLLRPLAMLALTTPLWFAAGCKQGVNERCQVQSDCDDGLLCLLPPGGTPQVGGTCQMPSTGNGADLATPPATDLGTSVTTD